VSRITLIPVGAPPSGVVEELAAFLASTLGRPCRMHVPPLDPAPAFDPARGQYDARVLLRTLDALALPEDRVVLGVADVDLCSPLFTFVFGEARLGGRAGIFSVHRLDPVLYGLASDPTLLLARARKEALHETGHLMNLVHCREPECVMRFSGAAEEVDLKPGRFCRACAALAAAGWDAAGELRPVPETG